MWDLIEINYMNHKFVKQSYADEKKKLHFKYYNRRWMLNIIKIPG